MKQKGFTLIEVLIVLSILAISFALAYPALSRFSARLTLQAAARTLASDFRALQAAAVSKHRTLNFQPEKATLPGGIKVVATSLIGFSPSGFTPPGGSGTWTLKNRLGDQKKIIVSSMGRVRVE